MAFVATPTYPALQGRVVDSSATGIPPSGKKIFVGRYRCFVSFLHIGIFGLNENEQGPLLYARDVASQGE